MDCSEQEVMLVVLGLINVVVTSSSWSWSVMATPSSLASHPDQPGWLNHVNAGVLAVKLAMAVSGISCIHLLHALIG